MSLSFRHVVCRINNFSSSQWGKIDVRTEQWNAKKCHKFPFVWRITVTRHYACPVNFRLSLTNGQVLFRCVAGRIHLSLSWLSLYSSPVVVVIEDVYVLAGPITDQRYDASHQVALMAAMKQAKLNKLEARDGESQAIGGSTVWITRTVVIFNNVQENCSRIM